MKVFDPLEKDFQLHFMQLLAIVAVITLIPFIIMDFLNGKYLLAMGIFLIITGLLTSAWKIHLNTYDPRVTYWVILPALLVTLLFAFYSLGIQGALWLYPAVVVIHLIIPRNFAYIANTLLLTTTGFLAWHTLEYAIFIRLIASLTVVSIFIAIFVEALKAQKEELRRLATTDPLTGLASRTTLAQKLDNAIAQSERAAIPTTLIAMDLDFFKHVNDKNGHAAGDAVLQAVAKLLQEHSRITDCLFRTGGEEFLILLFNSNLENATYIANTLRSDIEANTTIPLTASFGVATHQPSETRSAWLSRADRNLYKAKESGRNRVIT